MRTYRLLMLSLPLVLAACGGAADPSVFDEPTGDASSNGDTATSGTDTGTGGGTDTGTDPTKDTGTVVTDTAPPPPAITLDNVCDKLADAYCTPSLASCCGTKSLAWKEGGCRDAVKVVCKARVDDVKAGDATFNPGTFAGCQAAWSALTTKCSVPALEFIKLDAACDQLFVGSVAPGSSCAEDWECKVPVGSFANCSGSGRCESISVAAKDQPCVYSGSVRAICDYGLACQFASGTSGTCSAAKMVGAACNYSTECGFGYYCQRGGTGSGGKCAPGLTTGTTCYSNESCASGSCAGGRCTDPNYTPANTFLCSGTG